MTSALWTCRRTSRSLRPYAYEDLPDVEYADPNFLLKPASVSNAPSFDQMYVVNNTGQTVGTPDEDIDVFEA